MSVSHEIPDQIPRDRFQSLVRSHQVVLPGELPLQLDLEAAINIGALTKYRYYPQVVSLDGDEMEQYVQLSEQIV
jgi:hypothetical protein